MTYSEKGKALRAALAMVKIPDGVRRAFDEVAFTASETGVIDIAFHGETEEVIKLVMLALELKAEVPAELRM